MEESNKSRLVVSVRDLKSLIHVDMPCFVKSSSSAIKMLGGEELIASSFDKDSNAISLKFPGDNICSSHQIGNKIENNGFLVKIRRRKTTTPNDSDVSVSIIGVVKKSYVFNSPSDYQFLPTSTSVDYYTSTHAKETPLIETVPSVFYRPQFIPGAFLSFKNLKFPVSKSVRNKRIPGESHRSESDGEEGKVKQNKKHPDAGLTAFIQFGDPIPQSHVHGDRPRRWEGSKTNFRGIQLIAWMKDIFAVIPMLTKHQLLGILNIPRDQNYLFNECLPYAAYCFAQGPFRGLWVRYGYDPAQHPESKIYQTMTIRLAPATLEYASNLIIDHMGGVDVAADHLLDLDTLTVKEKPSVNLRGASSPFTMFGVHMKHQAYLQMYLLADPVIMDFWKNLPTQSECRGKHGWFSAPVAARLRAFVLRTMSDRIDMFLKSPVVVEKGVRIANPIELAQLRDFDIQHDLHLIQEYLDHCRMENEQASIQPVDLFEPNFMLFWLGRYLSPGGAGGDSGYSEPMEEEPIQEQYVPEVQVVKVGSKVRKPVKESTAAKSTSSSSRKASVPQFAFKRQPASSSSSSRLGGVPFTNSGGSSSSNNALQSISGAVPFNILGEEVEAEEDDDEYWDDEDDDDDDNEYPDHRGDVRSHRSENDEHVNNFVSMLNQHRK